MLVRATIWRARNIRWNELLESHRKLYRLPFQNDLHTSKWIHQASSQWSNLQSPPTPLEFRPLNQFVHCFPILPSLCCACQIARIATSSSIFKCNLDQFEETFVVAWIEWMRNIIKVSNKKENLFHNQWQIKLKSLIVLERLVLESISKINVQETYPFGIKQNLQQASFVVVSHRSTHKRKQIFRSVVHPLTRWT